MAGVDTTELGQLTLTPMSLVTVRADGIQLQDGLWARPLQLGGPELELLATLSRQPVESPEPVIAEVAERTGATTDRLQQFVTHLRYSGRLRPVSPWRHRDVPDHPTLDRRPPLALQSPESISFRTPQALRLHDGVFEIVDHDGLRTAVLTPREVEALARLVRPVSPADFAARATSDDFDEQAVAQLLGRLDGAGLLRRHVPSAAPVAAEPAIDRDTLVREIFDRHAKAQDAAEQDRVQRTGRIRPKVVPVAFDMGAPAGVGMVVACAKAFDGGRLDDYYDFRTDWVWSDDRLDDFTSVPAVYLFSDYLWSHERCIDVSKRIKERSPSSITIHGGPDAPKYEADTAAYFAAHPHVDVLIRGEGELTAAETLAALMSVVGDEHPDLSVLAGVTGITYRDGEQIVRNGERDRVVELDDLPSPYLTGLFDVFKDVPDLFVTLETNRGCPYSCTFCDWGSATNSRIRKFDLDRVYAELEWCADVAVASVSVADANFGIFERDVEIAAKVAELRTTRGHPQAFGVSFAKNTVKHLQHIITVLADAGIMAQGVLSLQTMDETTLDAIHRSNIKTEKYDALADEMRGAQLPLMVELMMGLPGQTLSSFADDIQQCIDREVPSRVNHTALLVNSPMNDPDYRAEHQIQVSEGVGPGLNSTVIATSSFTTDDYAGMEKIRLGSLIYENFGVLRLVSRFVRQETGVREMDFYLGLRTATEARPQSWPALFALVQFGTAMMAPPYSWALVMADLHDCLVSEFGVLDDDALDTVLRCQRALLPAHGRQFPEVLSLAHDLAAWHQDMQAAKGSGHRTDWPETVARLVTYGPGEIRIDDPHHIVDTSLGLNSELSVIGMNWEFDSPLSRARLAATQLVDWATDSMLPLTSDDEPSTVSVDLASG